MANEFDYSEFDFEETEQKKDTPAERRRKRKIERR